jgi:hypothetical protein
MSQPITHDSVDVIQAAEALGFIDTWLAQAPPAVITDFERYAWPYTLDELRSDLAALTAKLGVTYPDEHADTGKTST